MVFDEDLTSRLIEILNGADLTVTTTAAIRRQLEADLGVDLTEKKVFIRQQIDIYLQSNQHQQEEQEVKPEQENDGGEEVVQEASEEAEGEEEEEEVEQPEPDSRRLQAKIDRVKRESLQKERKKRTGGGGLNKSCALSPELQAIIGEKEMPRTQVVKALWVYIREKKLQDPDNRRKIICDKALRAVIGSDSTDMFKMNKLLSKHIWPLDSLADSEPKPKRPKTEKKESSEKGGKARGGGFTSPLPLSQELINFFGTGESELSRAEVVKRMWDYIKGNQLQDPADKRRIVCDRKLQELFGCDTFIGFSIAKHLAPHFIKS